MHDKGSADSPAMMRKAFAVSDRPEANLARVRKKCALPSVLRRRMPKIRVAVVLSDSTLSMDCRFLSLYSFAMCFASLLSSIWTMRSRSVQ